MTTATSNEPTEFLPELAVTQIKPHPANPRREAKADDEMVASIKERGLVQPLVVAPASKGKHYVILAGHRRLDGLKRAKVKTAPAIVRHDVATDAEQIEFAVVENVHRKDLTPMEEAEAFDHLRQLKYTQTQIAQKTGRPVSAVRDRLKLIKLSAASRDALHAGQLTIGDAFDLLEFADDPKTEAALTKKAGQPGFRQHIEEARRKRARDTEIAAAREKHKADGVPEVKWPTGVNDTWALGPSKGIELVRNTAESDPKKHKDCLAFLVGKQSWHQTTYLVCTKPKSHKRTLTAAEKRQKAADEKAKQQRAEQAEREDIARTLRAASIYELVGEGVQFTPRFRDVLRALMPALVWDLYGDDLERYFTAMALDGDRRWAVNHHERTGDKLAPFTRHARELAEGSDATLAKALTTVLLNASEDRVDNLTHYSRAAVTPPLAAAYFELLAGIGHEFTETDNALRDAARTELANQQEANAPASDLGEEQPNPDDASFEPHPFAGKEGYACPECQQPQDSAVHQIAATDEAVA